MASESSGPKDQPYFSSSGAPAIDVDPGLVADYAALVGNRKVLTTAQRLALTGKAVWDGLEVWDTDLKSLFVRDTGAWVLLFSLPATGTAGLDSTNWNTPGTMSLVRRSGFAFLRFNGGPKVNQSIGAKIVDIPAGFRTDANVWLNAWGLGGAPGSMQVYYDASVNQVKLNGALAVGQSVAISMMWPVTA